MTTKPYKSLVFCDFDGTITVEESLRNLLIHFIPDTAHRLMNELDQQRMSIREGVEQLIHALPSHLYDDIIDFALKEPIRPGFAELLDDLSARNIPFIVLSSGLRFTIEQQLTPWKDKITHIHALDVDTSSDYMRLIQGYNHPTEAMPKAWVMKTYPTDQRIAIGDGLSDMEMIKVADIVFARDVLLEHMNQEGLAVTPYDDFFQIKKHLSDILS